MPDYQCAICDTVWIAKAEANLTCATLSCNNAKLKKVTLRLPVRRKRLAQGKERLEGQKKARQDIMQKLRKRNEIKNNNNNNNYGLIFNYNNNNNNNNSNNNDNNNYFQFSDDEDENETLKLLKKVDDDEKRREAEDSDFIPTAERWNFDQRLTKGNMVPRKRPDHPSPYIKNEVAKIGAPIDGERQIDCAIIMGLALKMKRIAAWGLTSLVKQPIGTRWFAGNKNTAEWCHLIGVSLGGKTLAANLVSASYCANTYMGVIEKAIHGRADLMVQVQVEGIQAVTTSPNYSHIADWIIYSISWGAAAPPLVFHIDARINAFSAQDAAAVQEALKTLPKQK